MISRIEALNLIKNNPVEIGIWSGYLDLTSLHNEWLKAMIFGTEDYTLQAHRLSYKTTCLSIAIALYCICFPSKNIMFYRKTDSDVREVLSQSAKVLKNPKVRYLAKAIWGCDLNISKLSSNAITTNLYTTPRGAEQVVGMGIYSSMTGKHCDLIITDDIVNLNDRLSKAERDRTKSAYQELQNIRNHDGRIFNAGTPWHRDDCFSIMPNIHRWDCYSTGIMSPALIEEKKRSLTHSLFSINYELKHIADDDVLFSEPIFFESTDELQCIEALRDGLCHIDASYGGEDSTAVTFMRKKDGKLYALGKLYHKHVDNCIVDILSLKKKYMIGKTFCEDNGDKGYLRKRLRDCGDSCVTYHESTNKYIKITTELYRDWANIRWLHDTDSEYLEEICDYNENAEHDDAPDSASSICRILYKRCNNENYLSLIG